VTTHVLSEKHLSNKNLINLFASTKARRRWLKEGEFVHAQIEQNEEQDQTEPVTFSDQID
jgi:hypothetical protein